MKKHTPLIPTLAKQLRQEPGRVLPIVIGTRGALPKSTIPSLEDLGITDRGSLITLSLLALRSSIEIYHAFIECDVPSRKLPTLLVDQIYVAVFLLCIYGFYLYTNFISFLLLFYYFNIYILFICFMSNFIVRFLNLSIIPLAISSLSLRLAQTHAVLKPCLYVCLLCFN